MKSISIIRDNYSIVALIFASSALLLMKKIIYKMTYINIDKDEASFQIVNSNVIFLEKEVLLYDFSDAIGTIGGSLGVFVGISFFAVISCCIDKFFEILNIFQTKTLFERISV